MVNSVTFPSSLGGDNSTVDDSNSPTTGLGNNGHRTRFIPALSQTVIMAQTAVTGASNAAASAATASTAATTATTKASEAAASASAADASASAAEASALSASNDADAVAAGLALIAGGPVASINGKTGIATINASEVPFTPTGNIAATNTQAAIAEIDSEKASKDGVETLTNKTLETPAVTIGGSYGVSGQVLASQGAGMPVGWVTPATIPNGTYLTKEMFTSSGSLIVPAGKDKIRGYAVGMGGYASALTSGGGGGMAFGDIAVTAGETLTINITSGAAKLLRGATVLLQGNSANYATAGTASKDASVTNGGAYSGGSGVTAATVAGGASAGSPLGTGKNSFDGVAGGAGIASTANSYGGGSGGGGGGGGGGSGGRGGAARSLPAYTDPLISRCDGAGGNGSSSTALSIGNGADGGGGGGYSGTGTGAIGGNGGFGAGGGGCSGTNGTGGNGGHLAGGGGAISGLGGGNGGFGGGGGTTGGWGGAACVWIFY